ncbi:nucleotidyltransferase domain-containing protein [Desulfolutivibrio sulfoxidireducens]|uniref:nucleotidyltransferase domain-containing protein n=1 Tax=Desulfolutivibrio sulfoxidireducens TaxID=2773299 RepID=UPI00159DC2A5|nr:nucleotidyltransferase domain-containing protein [Desulfolutivibrio sulfoxidireducens]QLA17434.1 hypothetical protein GD605_15770 [Desulfolutivibrio sulfoxidireducens]
MNRLIIPKFLDHIDCIAVFGSHARGDNDTSSDKDILLVTDAEHSISEYIQFLTNSGWSVSTYDWNKIERLINCNSLFLQHLKQESNIVLDKNSKLAATLNNFHPSNNYNSNIETSKALFNILKNIPDDTVGSYWALDVALSSLRNYVVSVYANNGVYFFSFTSLSKAMSELGFKNFQPLLLLNYLRLCKRKYRSYSGMTKINKKYVLDIISNISTFMGLSMVSEFYSPKKYIVESLVDNLWNNSNWDYAQVRLAESMLNTIIHSARNSQPLLAKQAEDDRITLIKSKSWFIRLERTF